MNKIHHHPDDATLAAYAAGTLPAALALVVGCHLEYCEECMEKVRHAEAMGGSLLDDAPAPTVTQSARDAMLARLDALSSESATTVAAPTLDSAPQPGTQERKLPRKLQRLLKGAALDDQAWKSAGKGVRVLKLECNEGNAILLDIMPGHAVPAHSHKGTELTLILDGDYDDELGHFASGDVADLDSEAHHQPVAGSSGCLCLAGLDAPLKYEKLLPRLLQPLFPI